MGTGHLNEHFDISQLCITFLQVLEKTRFFMFKIIEHQKGSLTLNPNGYDRNGILMNQRLCADILGTYNIHVQCMSVLLLRAYSQHLINSYSEIDVTL